MTMISIFYISVYSVFSVSLSSSVLDLLYPADSSRKRQLWRGKSPSAAPI